MKDKGLLIVASAITIICVVLGYSGKFSKRNPETLIDNGIVIRQDDISTPEFAYFYNDLETLTQDSEYIFYGEVKDVKYIHRAMFTYDDYTQEKVKVLSTIKGDLPEKITVKKMQSYRTFDDYIKYREWDFRLSYREDLKEFSPYSPNDLRRMFVKTSLSGDHMSKVGQRAIYFLADSTWGRYVRMNESTGEFIEISENEFNTKGFTEKQTYEEIVNEINAYLDN
ncbi:hypothetical protein M2454_000798 [Aequitasia blattaphilus]|uniref:Uncharacterized protein n=1 Tax=Aequitasia blattaphilus TaxID=2949332 RepID=A0ABT1E887_9FIRM|nr:hypothetical protein [Aequitasia blattaphilus]MCP1102003.1 hypothetical protein [Aequitasia blattaphilus]MCR8614643.1 hypothetical protein [Aequitasia blattaphilus]